MQFSKKVEFIQVPDWYYNIEYSEELKRGYDFKEDLFVRAILKCPPKREMSLYSPLQTEEMQPDQLKEEF